MKDKLIKILDELNISLVEREKHIKLALLGVLSGENLILVGPPGTAKSEISRRVAEVFDTKYFEYLLTKFTTPEELFGPVSIRELENDSFRRKTEGYLSDSNIVFLDEIFKSNSSILNSLLTILNEKIYHNGNLKEETDIYSIISASNELPVEEGELLALFDRFLLRVEVEYVKDTKKLIFLEDNYRGIPKELKLDIDLLKSIKKDCKKIDISEDISNVILNIKEKLDGHFDSIDSYGGIREKVSDRKLVKSLGLLKVSALTNNREKIDLTDLLLLKNCFWNRLENRDKINEIIINEIIGLNSSEVKNLEDIARVWTEEFNSLFNEQIKDEDGNALYKDINGNLVKEDWGDIHVRDKYGEYIFFKGHSEYVKVLAELGKFDHGYIDTGIVSEDGKIVWSYEFSPVDVITSSENEVDGYEKLVVKGKLREARVDSYEEYIDINPTIEGHIISKIKGIKRNIEDERKDLRRIKNKVEIVKNIFRNSSNIWLDRDEIDALSSKVEGTYNNIEDAIYNIEEIIRKSKAALELAGE